MKIQIIWFIALALFCGTSLLAEDAVVVPKSVEQESAHLRNIRRLTFAGSKNGEAYFSADGKQIVFQGVRDPENPFYQIYRMDLATGQTARVSTGAGKTTCAYFRPDGKRILFASTHLDPKTPDKQRAEIEVQKQPVKKRYAWDFDENFDIFESDPDGGNLIRLTDAPGYDAEGSYSPDGKSIVFCSMRDGDGEIYVMDADGKNPRRLTHEKGYDGGPFFSPDGKQIVWRHFEDEAQRTADLWIMDADGANKKQITKLGAVTWAPFWHPSGKWLVFASNFEDPSFELYAIRPDGTGQTRLTFTPGFDGLPAISPDGRQLMWTSNRSENKSHIFIADLLLPVADEPVVTVSPLLRLDAETTHELGERFRALETAGQEFRIEHEVARQYHMSQLKPFAVGDEIDDTFFIFGPRITGWLPPVHDSTAVIATLAIMQGQNWSPCGIAAQAQTIKQQVQGRALAKIGAAPGLYFTATSSDDLATVYKDLMGDLSKTPGVQPTAFVSLANLLNATTASGNAFRLRGAGTSPGFRLLAERLAALHPELSVELDESPDDVPELKQFTEHDVPSLALVAGERATFSVEEMDLGNRESLMLSASSAVRDALRLLSSGGIALPYTRYDAAAARAAAEAAKRPYLGTIPEYKPGAVPGVTLSGVRDASPAQAAGLKGGDVIVELNGHKIDDVNGYLQALETVKIGEKATLKFIRDGKPNAVEIVPGAR